MGSAEKFCLRWNDFESNISVAFRELREDKDFFDVTLACDDDQIQGHKVILSACSPFFRSVLRKNPHQHPLLYLKGVKYADLVAVLNFMYHGEVNVAQEELNSFLAVAEDLRVKGLTQNNSSDTKSSKSDTPVPKPRHREPPERSDTGPPPKRPRPPPPAPSPSHHPPAPSQDPTSRQSFHNSDDDDIQEVVPVKSEPVSHTETNNTVAMAPPPEPVYEGGGPSHGIVADPGEDNSSMYGDDYGDYGQYGSEADGSFDGSMMDSSMAGSASADGNKELDRIIEESMDPIYLDNETLWKCKICQETRPHKSHMKNHVETHVEGITHFCHDCSKKYKTRQSLKMYIHTNH